MWQCVAQSRPISQNQQIEQQKGRQEIRILKVFEASRALQQNYAGLCRVLEVRRIRTEKGKTSDVGHYYISSLRHKKAALFQTIIRGHWAIENQLHWVKDVILKEDSTKFHTYKTFKMNALYRNYVCSCIKLNGYASIKYTLESLRTNPKKIIKLIRT